MRCASLPIMLRISPAPNWRRCILARRSAPGLVALEDLDALIEDENRAFLLNELDGFADNEGVVVIASTNHPEKLDPAILDRPIGASPSKAAAVGGKGDGQNLISSGVQPYKRSAPRLQ